MNNHHDTVWILGQIIGFICPLLGILSYQMKKQKDLLLLQLINSSLKSINYLLLGGLSGAALNLLGTTRNIVFFRRNLLGKRPSRLLSSTFALLTVIIGILVWDDWYSIFYIAGMAIHAFCMGFSDAQNVRKSMLVTSPLAIVYDAFILNFGGILYESIAILSSITGLIRHRSKKS